MNKTPHKPQFQASFYGRVGIPEENATSSKGNHWGFSLILGPLRHDMSRWTPEKNAPQKACSLWLWNPLANLPQDLEDVVKLSKRLGRETRAQKGFCCTKFTRGAASQRIHHPAILRTSWGKLRSTLTKQTPQRAVCYGPFNSRCRTALFVTLGKERTPGIIPCITPIS